MRLLVVTHAFPPDENPRAFRWGAVVEQLAERGHVVDVVTRATHGEPAESTWRPGVVVHRAEESVTGRLREALGGGRSKERTPVEGKDGGPNSRSRWLGRVARTVHDLTWKQVFWPDFACLWIGNAARTAARLLEQHHYDGLITVSNPFSSHLVGRRLKPWQRGLRWLVDIGDPFSAVPEVTVNNTRLYAAANRAAETSVVEHADTVMVTTPGTRDVYAAAFPNAADRIVVVPPSFSLPEPTRSEPTHATGPTRLVFAGRLYRGIRNPQPVLNLIHSLTERGLDLEFHVFGDASECADLFRRSPVGDRVHRHGQVSRADVWKRMQEADVLVNLGNATSCQLPSKVVEYLWTGRPILNLVQRDDDSSADFFDNLSHVLNVRSTLNSFGPADVDRVGTFLTDMPNVDRNAIRRHLEPYSVEAVARQYESLLFSSVSRRAA